MIRVTLKRDQLWGGVLYFAGDRLVPDNLAAVLGLMPPSSIPSDPSIPSIGALAILNAAQHEDELVALPTIGRGFGRKLLALRPASGFESLEQARTMLDESRVDWDAIALWRPED
ncbi:MAG: hypothetical protein AAFX78_04915 [Cyanobacteria bacterium J06638_20]